jgi:stage II sporulation protein P
MLTRLQRQRQKVLSERKISVAVVVLLFLGIAIWKHFEIYDTAIPASKAVEVSRPAAPLMTIPKWTDILCLGVPGLRSTIEQKGTAKVKSQPSFQDMLRDAVLFLTSVDFKDARTVFAAEIPVFVGGGEQVPAVTAADLPNFPKFTDAKASLAQGKPLVAIYHTHTSEAYIPSFGADHAPGGQRGDIVAVGAALVKALGKYGIVGIQSTTVHDYPSFLKAYGASEITARKMLADYPSLQMIFDIHRDAGTRAECTAVINGTPVAKITIVVATGQPNLEQPHWKQNYAFAKLIDAKLNQKFPGVSGGIQLTPWRYNEHLHPRALLLEVGCEHNSEEEAARSMAMLAQVLAEIIKENNL